MSSDWSTLLEEAIVRSQGEPTRKQDRSRRTQQQILQAALRVFARDGISRSRIADVAADAGIPTSTLYEYYDSKESLAYDIPMSHLAAFYTEFLEAAHGIESPCERIQLYLSMSADFARRNPDWGRLFYLEIWPSVLVSQTALSHSVDDFARIVIHHVREAMAKGELPSEHDAYQTAAILLGGVNQVIITWLLYRRPRNLTKAGSEIVARTLNLLRSESGAKPKAAKRRARNSVAEETTT